ncbi:MAG: restriction endonuclease subunit S [Paracoccaceae bacterium]
MREGWEVKTLGEVADVKGGKRLPKGYKLEAEPTAHPYITVSDFTDDGTVSTRKLKYISDEVFEQIQRYTISSDDLYLSIAGTIGKTGVVPAELSGANLTENACKLVLRPGVDQRFLYYFTVSNEFVEQAGMNTRTTAQPKLALERLKTISLFLPPLAEQKRIVAVLDVAFEGIELALAAASKNLKNARELFETTLNTTFTQKGKGWVETTLGEVTRFSGGGTPSKSNRAFWDGSIPWVSPKDMKFEVIVKSIDKITHEAIEKSATKLIPEGATLIVVRSGILARTVPIAIVGRELTVNQDLKAICPNETILPKFLTYLMRANERNLLAKVTRGATVHRLSTYTLKSLPIYVPSLEVQSQISKKCENLSTQTQHLAALYQQKIDALGELKQSLLQKAFAGELTAQAQPLEATA